MVFRVRFIIVSYYAVLQLILLLMDICDMFIGKYLSINHIRISISSIGTGSKINKKTSMEQ